MIDRLGNFPCAWPEGAAWRFQCSEGHKHVSPETCECEREVFCDECDSWWAAMEGDAVNDFLPECGCRREPDDSDERAFSRYWGGDDDRCESGSDQAARLLREKDGR